MRKILLRVFVLGVGASSLLWSLWFYSYVFKYSPLERISAAILDGDDYAAESLTRIIAYLDRIKGSGDCARAGLVETAIVRLYAMEQARYGGDLSKAGSAHDAVESALACSPQNGFLWFQLFRVESLQGNALQEPALAYLRTSYKLTPHEAWIAGTRSRRALPFYDEFPGDLRASVRSEFTLLARDNPRRAVSVFQYQHENIRSELLPLLAEVPLQARREFARRLDSPDVEVPGVVLDPLSKSKSR